MFEGAVGSCDVVGVWIGLRVGGGAMLRVLACITLDEGPGVGTLGSSVVSNCGHSTLGDGLLVASGFVVPCSNPLEEVRVRL
jgi:hypothetical protein